MKTSFFFIGLMLLSQTWLMAQDCKVLTDALQGMYEGDCKNGLAHGKGQAFGKDTYTGSFKNGLPHGKGIYKWSTGEVYDGEWNMGKREGEGNYTRHDTVMAGLWKDDEYKGPKPLAPKIIQKNNIVSTTFTRPGDGNRISITFYQNGMPNTVEGLDIVTSNGTVTNTGKAIHYYDIIFPFRCRISYLTWNSLRTAQYSCVLEFEIIQPGSWELRITN
jgi:hypothetical protein